MIGMAQKDGFLLYDRQNVPVEVPEKRVRSFDEFRRPLSPASRRRQAARCMNCGVPFCQCGQTIGGMVTGCPLHNLIPEWNDMLYLGNVRHALDRLLKTNCFPEFTGRVCPALCEAACTCGLNGDSVTVHDNELAIIEEAYEKGWMQPQIPRVRTGKRVAVVGSGPSGLAAAYTLNRRGHSVTVYEKADRPGGLLMYGIPNMKLDKRVIARRITLMEQEGVVFQCNTDGTADLLKDAYDAVLLCCGAGRPRDLSVPGREAQGVHFAVPFLTAATRRLLDGSAANDPRGLDVVIVGGGDTGNDCVGTAIRLGCKSVTQLEMLPKPPQTRLESNPWPEWPRVLKTDYGQQEAIALFGHDPRVFETTVEEILTDDRGHVHALRTVRLNGRQPVEGSQREIPCGLLLIAAGFTGCVPDLPASLGAEMDAKGRVVTIGYQTGVPGLFAAGDMRRGQSLVVWAIREGREVAREVDQYLMGYSEL